MTLNTHSLAETDYETKLQQFVSGILAERPDVIALQEVNQTIGAPPADESLLTGYYPAQKGIPVRADNHAARTARLLHEAGAAYSWTYLPVKVGYGKYDEGLAMLSLNRNIACTSSCLLTHTDDYDCWKTRRALGIQVYGLPDWFYCIHMGWWQDPHEPARAQWQALNSHLASKTPHAPVWLMGDFNAPAEIRGETYDQIAASGWYDAFLLAARRDAGLTVPGKIDGWHSIPCPGKAGMRIDHIWCSRPAEVTCSRVMFSGEDHPVVSDHFGVMVEIQSK